MNRITTLMAVVDAVILACAALAFLRLRRHQPVCLTCGVSAHDCGCG